MTETKERERIEKRVGTTAWMAIAGSEVLISLPMGRYGTQQ